MIRKLLFLLPMFGGLYAAAQNMVYATTRKARPGDELAMQQPGKYVNDETSSWKPGYWDNSFAPGMTKRTDKMLALMKETFPGPTGFDVNYSREMFQRSYLPPPIRSYGMTFYCENFSVVPEAGPHMTVLKKLETGQVLISGDRGLRVIFKINDPSALYNSGFTLDLDGRSAHSTFPIQGKWKGVTIYGSRFLSDSALTGSGVLYIVIARNGESPYMPFTRKEFLQAKLASYDEQFNKDTANLGKSEHNIQKQLDDAQHAGKPAAVITAIQNDLKNSRQSKVQWTKRSADQRDVNKKPVLVYLAKKPADSLALPALVYGARDGGDVEEWFNPKKPLSDPQMYVVDNPAYWHNTADKATPQLIFVKMLFSTQYWSEYEVKKQFAANFPLEKFAELLDK